MLVVSNSRWTLSFFGYLEDLKSSLKLLPVGKAQEYCFPSRVCQEVTNTAEKSSVSPKSHHTYTFKTKTLTWEVLLQGTETSKHYNSLPTGRTPKYQLKRRFCKVPKSFALAMFARVCMLEFLASLADLKPFVSTKCSVACSCSNCILVGKNLGSYTIFHTFSLVHNMPYIQPHFIWFSSRVQAYFYGGYQTHCEIPLKTVKSAGMSLVHQGHASSCQASAPIIQHVWTDKVWVRHPHPMMNFFPW